jgi:hypothetical protein
MTFWQRQKVRAAMGFLRWRIEKNRQPMPDDAELERQADRLVAEAQRIARRTGNNFMTILKELINDLKK